jgi:hypothetical protein
MKKLFLLQFVYISYAPNAKEKRKGAGDQRRRCQVQTPPTGS